MAQYKSTKKKNTELSYKIRASFISSTEYILTRGRRGNFQKASQRQFDFSTLVSTR